MNRWLVGTMLVVAVFFFSIAGSAQAQLVTYTDETTYLNDLTTNGYSSFRENFEGPAWSPLVSAPQTSFTEQDITWTSRKQIKINNATGRMGSNPTHKNAIVSYDPANLLDHVVPDILRGQYQSSSPLLSGVGGWFNPIPAGSDGNPRKIIFLLDDEGPKIYEDGEDTDGWSWDGPVSSTATIASLSDTKRNSNVIEIGGGTFGFGTDPKDPASDVFTLTGGAPNTSQFIAEWSVRYVAEFAVYIEVSTSAGRRYLMYVPQGPEDPEVVGETVKYGLGLDAGELSENQRKWHIFVRDLQADLEAAQAPPGQPGWVGGEISQVIAFHLQGNVRVDDIEFHKISSGEFQIATGGYKFFGMIDTNGFKSFEIIEPEGSPMDQEIIFNADDFTFAAIVQPPSATDDTYSVDEGSTLTEVAPGVLGNDTGTGLTAILVSGPANHNGIFSLNPDGSFTYVHDGSETTSDSFTYKVNDGTVDSNTARVAITINAINEVPSIISTPVTSVTTGLTYTYNITTSDPDAGDTLSITATTVPAWLTLTDNGNGTATLTGMPTNAEVGNHPVELRVTDAGGLFATQSFMITVTDVNDPPIVGNIQDQTIAEGGSFTTIALDNFVTDPDNTDAEISWTFRDNTALTVTIDTTRVATITIPSADWNGAETITFIATDPGLLSSGDPATFTVTPVNDTPVADAGPDQTALVGDTVTLDGTGSNDVDGDPLSYAWSISSKPAASTTTLDSTDPVHPTFVIDEPGTYVVELIVNDGSIDSSPDTLNILVDDLDSDGDGMPDSWERANGLDPYIDDAAEDPDGDGFTNLGEYLANTDPNNPDSHPPRSMPWIPLLLLDN